jgi:hypothetical protein
MSEAAAKQARREIRRAVGEASLEALSVVGNNLEVLRAETLKLAERADANDRDVLAIYDRLDTIKRLDDRRPNPQTVRERLRWLLTGR